MATDFWTMSFDRGETVSLELTIQVQNQHSGADLMIKPDIPGMPTLALGRCVVDVAGITAAASEEGYHVIFTCACGYPGCAGHGAVRVRFEDDLAIWEWSRSRPFRAVFARTQVEKHVTRTIDVARVVWNALKRHDPQATWTPADNSAALAERLDE
ncbi:MAG: hypothetical protein R6X25_12270 [Candidatus Krumholzibacteriia bacterium]